MKYLQKKKEKINCGETFKPFRYNNLRKNYKQSKNK